MTRSKERILTCTFITNLSEDSTSQSRSSKERISEDAYFSLHVILGEDLHVILGEDDDVTGILLRFLLGVDFLSPAISTLRSSTVMCPLPVWSRAPKMMSNSSAEKFKAWEISVSWSLVMDLLESLRLRAPHSLSISKGTYPCAIPIYVRILNTVRGLPQTFRSHLDEVR